MRIFFSLLCLLITIALIIVFDTRLVLPAPLGQLLSPQHGIWQNAEAKDQDDSNDYKFSGLKGKTSVYIDERLVPHIFAEHELDAFFVQGFIHAKFRLWQMEFQTHAAAGRLSEVLGETINGKDVLNRADRFYRRLGLKWSAEVALAEVEKDPETKAQLDAYTSGVNAYISELPESAIPLEYKLLGYKPELWTNLKTILFLKYMSYDLAGGENDFEHTNMKTAFGIGDYELLFPRFAASMDPVIPKDTAYPQASVIVQQPGNADSVYFNRPDSVSIMQTRPDQDNGSNNWAVGGAKTRSGAPILCNDPHLGLNLPSIWFEMQIHTPEYNAYGVSFPGAPYIIIGFNDSCAFGVTNAGRDVRDYYEIKFRDESMKEYWFNDQWKETVFHYDTIRIKNKAPFVDTIAFTVFGPVMYDSKYTGDRTDGKCYAVKWTAHEPGNELRVFNLLDKAKNYNDYYNAIKHMNTPGQNFVFASKAGDIALWAQGRFPAKWKRQGEFIMPGTDSSYDWQGYIPQEENPHQVNPARNFVSSANQAPADSSYPYFLGGNYPVYRGLLINRYLQQMDDITPERMMKMQADNYNLFAETARPLLLRFVDPEGLDAQALNYLDMIRSWNLRNDPEEKGATAFMIAWDSLEHQILDDEYHSTTLKLAWPNASTIVEALEKDSTFKFVDDMNTPEVETIHQVATTAFKKAVIQLEALAKEDKLEWWKFKDTRVGHLLSIPAFSKTHLPIGGGVHMINATKTIHGASWRMVVHLTTETEAYGVYPGGQSGNPGSPYYDNFIDNWVKGAYYRLWVMKAEESRSDKVKSKMTFSTN